MILEDFKDALARRDYLKILRLYDNKGLLSEAAHILGIKGAKELIHFVNRALRNKDKPELRDALRAELPTILQMVQV